MDSAQTSEFSFTAYRRDAYARDAGRRIGHVCAVASPALVAVVFAWIGAWPVVVFAGAVSLSFVWLLACIHVQDGDFERVLVKGDRLIIETCTAGRLFSTEFNRYWARLVVSGEGRRNAARLWVRSHGKQIEIGWLASADRKAALAQHLQSWVGTAYH